MLYNNYVPTLYAGCNKQLMSGCGKNVAAIAVINIYVHQFEQLKIIYNYSEPLCFNIRILTLRITAPSYRTCFFEL
jgi:hypothetical protein